MHTYSVKTAILIRPFASPSSEGVTGLKELAFLRDLAEQNSVKYGVPDRSALPVVKGSMMVLNQLSNLETTVGRFYINLPNRMIDVASFSLPYADQMGDGKLRSRTWHKAWHTYIPLTNHMHSEDLSRNGSATVRFHGNTHCKLKLQVTPKITIAESARQECILMKLQLDWKLCIIQI